MYAKPLEVWDQIDHSENRKETFNSSSSGEDIDLDENYLIQDAFTVSGTDQDVYIEADGSVADTADYEVDLRDGRVTWNGNDGADLKIRYKTAPIPNSSVVSKIEAVSDEIDDVTNTTYNGTEEVTHTYDFSRDRGEIVLYNRPVDEVTQVRYNQANTGSADDFETLDLGRDGDLYLQDELSVRFTRSAISLKEGVARVEITYTYGYSDIPTEINELTRMMVAKRLMDDAKISEAIDGRDDFNPRLPEDFITEKRNILDRWTIQRMGEQIPSNL